tara:strand:- start:461 stop:1012 length:552 start_codon:yes stop_codon:yes gene_type:complete
MKLPTQKIELAAPKNDHRSYLSGAYLNVETSELVVTDGHILVKHSVELDDGDISGIIPLDAFAHARKTKSERITTAKAAPVADKDGWIGDNTTGVPTAYTNGASFPLVNGTYPDYCKVIPEPADVTIRLDLTLLDRIRKAMFEKASPNSTCQVTFRITDGNSSVRIETGKDDNVAVIMPCRVT